MNQHFLIGPMRELMEKAGAGTANDVDFIMAKLTLNATLAMTRFVDYSLSQVENPEGLSRIKFYLFHGTLIQRNYASLFFNRRDEWKCVKEAFDKGLIDEIQAFAR